MPEATADLPVIEPAPEPTAPKKPHEAFRARAEARRRRAAVTAAGGAWTALAIAMALVFGAAYFFRVDVVTAWPRAASAYALAGLEVNASGVAIDRFIVSRGEEDGLPAVIIEGEVRNIDRRLRPAPPMRAALLDAEGRTLLEWTVLLEGGPLIPGGRRAFRTVVTDPPRTAVEAEIAFTEAAG